ncbi:MAG TPA: hypothetical protein VMQ58_02235 [Candidatus Saccharimonadales bacterium]|jgi:hypothetical protein|nr:hypothetical protein [Candidatus Saccharimonadales bacterium]
MRSLETKPKKDEFVSTDSIPSTVPETTELTDNTIYGVDITTAEALKTKELSSVIAAIYGVKIANDNKKATVEANYIDIAKKLEGKVGEPVLLITRWHKISNTYKNSPEDIRVLNAVPFTEFRSSFRLGILNGSGLIFDSINCICMLPTSMFFEINTDDIDIQSSVKPMQVTNPFRIQHEVDLGLGLEPNYEPTTQGSKKQDPKVSIFIGKSELIGWLDGLSYTDNKIELSSYLRLREQLLQFYPDLEIN